LANRVLFASAQHGQMIRPNHFAPDLVDQRAALLEVAA